MLKTGGVTQTGGTKPVAPAARRYRLQRVLDWAVLVVAAPFLVPLGALIAAGVAMTSRGPVFFTQERVGLGAVPFRVVKFRTMVDGDNPLVPDPTRITKVGALLRRLSLDELPQLLNVARGEMSVVGPRPTIASQVERYTDEQRRRLSVRPGLTGPRCLGVTLCHGRNGSTTTWPTWTGARSAPTCRFCSGPSSPSYRAMGSTATMPTIHWCPPRRERWLVQRRVNDTRVI